MNLRNIKANINLNNIKSKVNDEWDYHKSISSEISRIKTGSRHNIGKIGRKKEDENDIYEHPCPTEIDSHADTHCFGKNFQPMHLTGQEFSVLPFLVEYYEQINIQICTGATAHTLESGTMIIILFGQGLRFRNRIEKV